MKKTYYCIVIVYLFMFMNSFQIIAQVNDIGIDFTKKGFLRDFNLTNKLAIIDFVDDKAISTELVELAKNCKYDNLRIGMGVSVTGEYFRKTNTSVVSNIKKESDYSKRIKIDNGRIDAFENDYVVIDGYKVKLNDKAIIKGVNGYNKKFSSINQLLLGDIANIKGFYYSDGFLYADSFEVQPDVETEQDKIVKSGVIGEIHKQLYDKWIDKNRRRELYGKDFGLGAVVKNDILQDYIQNLGLKLIPEHIKNKINYMFIVVDNPEFNAGVFPNGLSYVNTGLLYKVKNEAQIAAVLGHEIAHAIYEHGAEKHKNFEEVEKQKEKMKKANQVYNILDVVLAPVDKTRTTRNKNTTMKIETDVKKIITEDLPIAILEKKVLSDYSVENESQADRVGLFLMAKAGFDPREASVVWQNEYNSSGGMWEIKKDSYLDNVLVDVAKTKKTKNASLPSEMIKSILKTNVVNNIKQKKKTHPYKRDRFESLHDMTYLFWGNEDRILKSSRGVDSWIAVLEKAIVEAQKR